MRCASLFGVWIWIALALGAAEPGQAADRRFAAVRQSGWQAAGRLRIPVDINTAAKNQLTQRGVLPDAEYGKIKDLIIARHSTK